VTIHRVLTFALAACAFAVSAFAASDQVKVAGGSLKGAMHDGVTSFKGIPFAAPPVGDLRWRPPAPAQPWKGVRAASEYGADCMQKPFPGDAAPLGVTPSEDCLYLNVWAPAYSPSTNMLMDFSPSGPAGKADPWKVRLDLVERLAAKQ
jgi:para-nitrobenzyl esterase